MKKFTILLAFALLALCLLCSCGGNDGGDDDLTTASYQIKVTDYYGNPSDLSVYVEIYKADEAAPNGEKFIKMLSANGEGIATVTLDKGDYHFKLSSADGEFYYDSESCKLSATETSKEIKIYNLSQDKIAIFPGIVDENGHEVRKEVYAPVVCEGATYVTAEGRSYFVFAPLKAGYYKVGFDGDEGVVVGYHGDANYVLLENNANVVDNSFELKSYNEGGISRAVIALNSEKKADGVLLIKYIRELEKDIPYTELAANESTQSSYDYNYLNKLIVDFDITDKTLSVVKGEDGYYHLNTVDGPVIMVRVASSSKYLASFKDICDKTRISCIEYDENGDVTLKESYNELFLAYAGKCDGAGICPLTDELARAIKKAGQFSGWFEGENTIFVTYKELNGEIVPMPIMDVVEENAYLFACCYIQPAAIGNEESPISLKTQSADENGEYSPYLIDLENSSVYLMASANGKIVIEDTDGLAVLVNGISCAAQDGKIIFEAVVNDIITVSVDKKCIVKLVFEAEKQEEGAIK